MASNPLALLNLDAPAQAAATWQNAFQAGMQRRQQAEADKALYDYVANPSAESAANIARYDPRMGYQVMGDERQLISLNNQYVGNPSTFRLAAWHLRRPLPSGSGYVDLTCRAPRCDGAVIVCEAACAAGPETIAVMELESLFVRRRQRDVGVIGLDRSIDLVSALSPADIRADKSTELFPDEDVTAAVAPLASEK